MKEALFYERLPDDMVRCTLCPHGCCIQSGKRGRCGARENLDGRLYSINYALAASLCADPVEKKPLKHFLSGTKTFSMGSFGCNLHCMHCQNFTLSREVPGTIELSPEAFVEMARAEECQSVAFTYNEPIVGFEWVADAAKAARTEGLATIMVTNGLCNREPWKHLLPLIDAFNIDVKAFSDRGYNQMGGTLAPVKDSVAEAVAFGSHVEITMLLVPGIWDGLEEIEAAAQWLGTLDENIPLHITRYFPAFRYTAPATDVEFMKRAQAAAEKHLKRVYLGNV